MKGKLIFWPDLTQAHHTPQVLCTLEAENIPFVPRNKNPPNVSQVRPIKDIWVIFKQTFYNQNCQAKNLDQLFRRIREKIKELNKKTLRDIML